MFVSSKKVFEKMNAYGKTQTPFIFIIDFEKTYGFVCSPNVASDYGIYYDFNGKSNYKKFSPNGLKSFYFHKNPITFNEYRKAFAIVLNNITDGNSYLANLTAQTPIDTSLSLADIFKFSTSRYKILIDNKFTVFSPEIFVQINEDNEIHSFPMKGTIDATIENAEKIIMEDAKEIAEHNTIVDLIRNDLSIVADDVRVKRFRYVEKIKTSDKSLLQVSSDICGKLKTQYRQRFGDIFDAILPAGSITGAPKRKTIEIIKSAENYQRGFYTGVMGYYDGKTIDSAVLIRFIKNEDGKLFFCSGGGITINSKCINEYNEMIDKVYVPII